MKIWRETFFSDIHFLRGLNDSRVPLIIHAFNFQVCFPLSITVMKLILRFVLKKLLRHCRRA